LIGPEPEAHFAQGHEAAHQKPRPDQQAEGQRDLHHDHRIAQPPALRAADRPLDAVPERVVQVAPRRLERRRQTEEEGRQDRDDDRKRQD
jgi:hypothetical protein